LNFRVDGPYAISGLEDFLQNPACQGISEYTKNKKRLRSFTSIKSHLGGPRAQRLLRPAPCNYSGSCRELRWSSESYCVLSGGLDVSFCLEEDLSSGGLRH
jgi:hypothetical protein